MQQYLFYPLARDMPQETWFGGLIYRQQKKPCLLHLLTLIMKENVDIIYGNATISRAQEKLMMDVVKSQIQ